MEIGVEELLTVLFNSIEDSQENGGDVIEVVNSIVGGSATPRKSSLSNGESSEKTDTGEELNCDESSDLRNSEKQGVGFFRKIDDGLIYPGLTCHSKSVCNGDIVNEKIVIVDSSDSNLEGLMVASLEDDSCQHDIISHNYLNETIIMRRSDDDAQRQPTRPHGHLPINKYHEKQLGKLSNFKKCKRDYNKYSKNDNEDHGKVQVITIKSSSRSDMNDQNYVGNCSLDDLHGSFCDNIANDFSHSSQSNVMKSSCPIYVQRGLGPRTTQLTPKPINILILQGRSDLSNNSAGHNHSSVTLQTAQMDLKNNKPKGASMPGSPYHWLHDPSSPAKTWTRRDPPLLTNIVSSNLGHSSCPESEASTGEKVFSPCQHGTFKTNTVHKETLKLPKLDDPHIYKNSRLDSFSSSLPCFDEAKSSHEKKYSKYIDFRERYEYPTSLEEIRISMKMGGRRVLTKK